MTSARTPAKATKRPAPKKALTKADDSAIAEAPVGEIEPESDTPEFKTASVEFHGRMIKFKAASADQVIVYHRINDAFADKDRLAKMSAEQQIALMLRTTRAIGSIMVNAEEDMGFIDDLILDGKITLKDALPLMVEGINAVNIANGGGSNRAERRAQAKSGTAALAID